MIKESEFSKEITEQIKEVVIARIEARMSPNIRLSIGADGSLDKSQMIAHVKNGDDIGKQIVQVHLNFMKAQSTGQLTEALNKI